LNGKAVAFGTRTIGFPLLIVVPCHPLHRTVTPMLAMLVAAVALAAHAVSTTHVAVHVLHRAAVGVLTCENNASEAENNESHNSKYFPFQPFVPP
jgi:hypothetical protein